MSSKDPKTKPASTKRVGSKNLTLLKFVPAVEGSMGVAEAVTDCQSCSVFMEFSNIPLELGRHRYEIEVNTQPRIGNVESLDVKVKRVKARRVGGRDS